MSAVKHLELHTDRLLLRHFREGVYVQSAAYQTSPGGEPIWSDYAAYAILRDEFLRSQR